MPNGIGEKGEERICGNLDLRKRECAKGEKKMEFWGVLDLHRRMGNKREKGKSSVLFFCTSLSSSSSDASSLSALFLF